MKNISLFESVSLQEKLIFTRHLAVMLKSGIPIAEAIGSIASQIKHPLFKQILLKVNQSVSNGQSLEKALANFPKVFDNFFVYMVRVGEESGNLEKNLEHLTEQLKKEAEFKKKVFSASLYPGIVITTAVLVSAGISLFVLPKLIELFQSLEVDLPLSTKILLYIAKVMRDYGLGIFLGLLGLMLLIRFLISLPKIKYQWQKMWLGLPASGTFLQNVQMSQMTRNIGVMLKSGLTISKALETQWATTTNLVFKEYLAKIKNGVDKGKKFSQVTEEGKFKYFPVLAARMIEVGEKTGKLDESLLYLGEYFEEEVDEAAKNLTAVLEPVLLLIVGLMVAFLAMAIISPIYQITSGVHR